VACHVRSSMRKRAPDGGGVRRGEGGALGGAALEPQQRQRHGGCCLVSVGAWPRPPKTGEKKRCGGAHRGSGSSGYESDSDDGGSNGWVEHKQGRGGA
jgi:hypothetical protein